MAYKLYDAACANPCCYWQSHSDSLVTILRACDEHDKCPPLLSAAHRARPYLRVDIKYVRPVGMCQDGPSYGDVIPRSRVL
jgi:hypothetical protein